MITSRLIVCVVTCLLFFAHPARAMEGLQDQSWQKKYQSLDISSESSLKQAIALQGPLGSWLGLQLAELYLQQKQFHEASQILLQVADGEPWLFWKHVRQAEAFVGLRQYQSALKSLETLPPEPQTLIPSQKFYRRLYRDALVAKKLALKNRGKEAIEITHRLWALFPDFESPADADTKLAVGVQDRLDRLHVLYALKDYQTIPLILQLGDIVQASVPQDEKCRAFYEWGTANQELKNLEQALDSFAQVVLQKCEGDFLARSLYRKAGLAALLKKYDEAIATHELFIKKFPAHQYTDDAYYALWGLFTQLKKNADAEKAWDKMMELPAGDLKSNSIWEAAYRDYREGKWDTALKGFAKIIDQPSLGDEMIPQAMYWQARTLDKLESAEAPNLYEQIRQTYPYSFYSVLASYRLDKPHPGITITSLGQELPADPLLREVMTHVDLLNSLGLQPQAQALLDYLTLSQPTALAGLQTLLAQKWLESGDYHRAITVTSEALDKSVYAIDLSQAMLPTFFPVAFGNELTKGATLAHLNTSIIQGIMREESLFRPLVRSKVGATGVMQLMPATAALEAKRINLVSFHGSELENPETNILLGSAFFRKMLNNYNQNIPLAVMAYNAGPGNVDRWIKKQGNLALDEFIEECPFGETRNYVKRVIRSIQIYGHILQDPEIQKPFFSMNPPQL